MLLQFVCTYLGGNLNCRTAWAHILHPVVVAYLLCERKSVLLAALNPLAEGLGKPGHLVQEELSFQHLPLPLCEIPLQLRTQKQYCINGLILRGKYKRRDSFRLVRMKFQLTFRNRLPNQLFITEACTGFFILHRGALLFGLSYIYIKGWKKAIAVAYFGWNLPWPLIFWKG